jgi:hypothetical protein
MANRLPDGENRGVINTLPLSATVGLASGGRDVCRDSGVDPTRYVCFSRQRRLASVGDQVGFARGRPESQPFQVSPSTSTTIEFRNRRFYRR